MMIYLSLLVAVIGAAFFLLSANPKYQELGKLSFFAGLFVFLYCTCTGQHPVSFLGGR